MSTLKRTATGTVLGGAMLVASGLSLAHAAPPAPPAPQAQAAGDGSVDVTLTSPTGQRIGVLQDVSVANAVTLVDSMCPISGITEANLNDLDLNGTAVTKVCGAMGGLSFSFTQNVLPTAEGPGQGDLGESTYAPVQPQNNPGDTGRPPSAVGSTPPGQPG